MNCSRGTAPHFDEKKREDTQPTNAFVTVRIVPVLRCQLIKTFGWPTIFVANESKYFMCLK